jgi:predicted small secreted protein
MKKSKTMALVGALACALLTGCETMGPGQGTGYGYGLQSLGHAMRPFANPNAPINTDPVGSMNSLQGMGNLLDLLSGR